MPPPRFGGTLSTATPPAGSGPVTVTRTTAPAGNLPAGLQRDLEAALAHTMAQYDVPGAVASVWLPGEGAWTTASGLADIEQGTPTSLDMTWPIRSITKSYTVTLLLQLADTGKLSLDDALDQYVDGVTNGDAITLLELANMSSGNADYVSDAFIAEWARDQSRVLTLKELNAGVIDQPAQFQPGTQHVYTNANTNLIGAVIEKVTGQPYADVLQAQILAPLGQTGTTYITDVKNCQEPHAVWYQPDPESVEMIAQDQNPSVLGAAGAMVSTLEDGRAWADVLGSGALVQPETQALREIGKVIERPPYALYAVGMGRPMAG